MYPWNCLNNFNHWNEATHVRQLALSREYLFYNRLPPGKIFLSLSSLTLWFKSCTSSSLYMSSVVSQFELRPDELKLAVLYNWLAEKGERFWLIIMHPYYFVVKLKPNPRQLGGEVNSVIPLNYSFLVFLQFSFSLSIIRKSTVSRIVF